jgi:hypothetical protein
MVSSALLSIPLAGPTPSGGAGTLRLCRAACHFARFDIARIRSGGRYIRTSFDNFLRSTRLNVLLSGLGARSPRSSSQRREVGRIRDSPNLLREPLPQSAIGATVQRHLVQSAQPLPDRPAQSSMTLMAKPRLIVSMLRAYRINDSRRQYATRVAGSRLEHGRTRR